MTVWLITGTSSGFGSEIAKQALARGDQVVATARNASKLAELKSLGALTLSLDITKPDEEVKSVVDAAIKEYGKIDILINNAGYSLEASVEEASDEEIKAQFATNVFGYSTVLRAVLPYMRAAKSGVIANMGSIAGWYGSPALGYYCATKAALVGITEALRAEVAPLGIKAVIIEPGYFRTNFLTSGAKITAKKVIEDYKPVLDPAKDALKNYNLKQPGDVVKGAAVIIEALTGTGRAEGKMLPARLPLGRDCVRMIGGFTERHIKELEEWSDLASTTDHEDAI